MPKTALPSAPPVDLGQFSPLVKLQSAMALYAFATHRVIRRYAPLDNYAGGVVRSAVWTDTALLRATRYPDMPDAGNGRPNMETPEQFAFYWAGEELSDAVDAYSLASTGVDEEALAARFEAAAPDHGVAPLSAAVLGLGLGVIEQWRGEDVGTLKRDREGTTFQAARSLYGAVIPWGIQATDFANRAAQLGKGDRPIAVRLLDAPDLLP